MSKGTGGFIVVARDSHWIEDHVYRDFQTALQSAKAESMGSGEVQEVHIIVLKATTIPPSTEPVIEEY